MDDREYEADDANSPPTPEGPSETTRSWPPGTLFTRRWRLVLTTASTLLALILALSVWLPLQNQPHAVAGKPSPTSSPLPPTPLPITSALASPPTSCPSAPPLTMVTVAAFDGFSGKTVQLSGRAPVWIPTIFLPQRITAIPEATPPSSAAPAWPAMFLLWEIGPTAHPTVTVQVTDLYRGTIAWWAVGNSSPQTPVLVLGPPPDQPPPGEGYLGYLTNLFITHAGCYKMTATWLGGSWSLLFAAGWGPAYPIPG